MPKKEKDPDDSIPTLKLSKILGRRALKASVVFLAASLGVRTAMITTVESDNDNKVGFVFGGVAKDSAAAIELIGDTAALPANLACSILGQRPPFMNDENVVEQLSSLEDDGRVPRWEALKASGMEWGADLVECFDPYFAPDTEPE